MRYQTTFPPIKVYAFEFKNNVKTPEHLAKLSPFSRENGLNDIVEGSSQEFVVTRDLLIDPTPETLPYYFRLTFISGSPFTEAPVIMPSRIVAARFDPRNRGGNIPSVIFCRHDHRQVFGLKFIHAPFLIRKDVEKAYSKWKNGITSHLDLATFQRANAIKFIHRLDRLDLRRQERPDRKDKIRAMRDLRRAP